MTPIPVNAQEHLSMLTRHMDTFTDMLELGATPAALAAILRAASLAANRAAFEFDLAARMAKP